MSNRVFNFSAGPAVLPEVVLQQAADEMLNYKGSGISVMEMSHRSGEFMDIIGTAEKSLRRLMNIPDNYKVLFLQGGASLQFLMVPMNLFNSSKKADYISTGAWAKKAIAEVKNLGDVKIVADSSDKTFSYIPEIDPDQIREESSYLHITSNNTIYGTRFPELPATNLPIVSDMSSMILSEPIDVARYGIIYAGAQKNIGPSGVTIVIIREDLIGKAEGLPSMLDYKKYTENGSLLNTPPTYAIYIAMLVFELMESMGGVDAFHQVNKAKAGMVYDVIDNSRLFKAHVQNIRDRSLMNIPFFAESDEINKKFIAEADDAGLKTLKGHRSVGGMRASIYNAMPIGGCEKLVEFIMDFDKANS